MAGYFGSLNSRPRGVRSAKICSTNSKGPKRIRVCSHFGSRVDYPPTNSQRRPGLPSPTSLSQAGFVGFEFFRVRVPTPSTTTSTSKARLRSVGFWSKLYPLASWDFNLWSGLFFVVVVPLLVVRGGTPPISFTSLPLGKGL